MKETEARNGRYRRRRRRRRDRERETRGWREIEDDERETDDAGREKKR